MGLIGTLGDLALEFGDSVFSVAAGLIGWLVGMLADLILILSAALPADFAELPTLAAGWETGLGWLNWWVPVGQIALVIAAWAAATVAYYAYKFILRHAGGR